MTQITLPDFRFSGHYYPEILEDLIGFLRANVPEITDEDPSEPAIQLLRAYALVGHLNNVLADIVGKEMFLPTAQLRNSVAALLALIDVRLEQASPATAELIATVTRTFAATTLLVAEGSVFATRDTPASPSIEYELLADVSTIRTDLVDKVYELDASGPTFTDRTAEAQSPAGSFTPWAGTPAIGDIIYIGHRDVLFDQLNIFFATAATGITAGVWEYHDGDFNQGNPTSVTNLGSTLEFNINSILGTVDRSGSTIRVRSNLTGAFEDVVSTFSGGANKVVTGFLGQTSPSTAVADYIVGADWRELPGLSDGSNLMLAGAGERIVSYTLPKTVTASWSKLDQLHASQPAGLVLEAYWLRFRVITVAAPTSPAINEIQIHRRKQYIAFDVSQGRSREDNPLASSTGLADQVFQLTRFPVLDDDNLRIFVDESSVEQEYTKVDNFLNSTASDRHFTVTFDDDGVATITFGDGVNGKIPPAGISNIRAEFRTMEVVDGNVGAEMITINRSGAAYITNIRNPRAASGFRENEGSDEDDLARVKVSGPASLRVQGRAIAPQDVIALAAAFVAADGSRPFARALAIEESFGPKTIECVVVGAGGGTVIATLLQELEDYFNGTETEEGVVVMNHQVEVTNFIPKVIAVTATVEGGSLASVQTALTALLNPVAQNDDGSFVWGFGSEVPRAKLIQAIMNTEPPPRDVTITAPAADVALVTRELPTVGTLTLTVLP